MRFGRLSAILIATVLSSGAASACPFYSPGQCGSSEGRSAVSIPLGNFNEKLTPISSALTGDRDEGRELLHAFAAGFRAGEQAGGLGGAGGSGGGGGSAGGGFNLAQLLSSVLHDARGDGDARLILSSLEGSFLRGDDRLPQLPGLGAGGGGSEAARATPLPASWTMMLIGLALFALFAVQRRFKPLVAGSTTAAEPAGA